MTTTIKLFISALVSEPLLSGSTRNLSAVAWIWREAYIRNGYTYTVPTLDQIYLLSFIAPCCELIVNFGGGDRST